MESEPSLKATFSFLSLNDICIQQTWEYEGRLLCGLQLSSRVSWLAPLVIDDAPPPPRTEVVSLLATD
jgi:hypothetical protein